MSVQLNEKNNSNENPIDGDGEFNKLVSTPDMQALNDQMESIANAQQPEDDTSLNPANNPSQGDYYHKFNPDGQGASPKSSGDRDKKRLESLKNNLGNAENDAIPYRPNRHKGATNLDGAEGSQTPRNNIEAVDGPQGKTRAKGFKGFLAGKKRQSGLVGIIISLLIGGSFMSLPPFQLLHIAQSLQNWHFWDDEQTNNWSTRRAINFLNGNRRFNNLGVSGNRMANHYEKKLAKDGIKMNFEGPDGRMKGSIQSLDVDPNTKGGQRFLERMAVDFPDVDLSRRSGDMIRIDTRGREGTKLGKSAVRTAVNDTLQLNKVSTAVSRRLLTRRSGVNFHPLRNIVRDRSQNMADKRRSDDKAKEDKKADKERRAKEVREGTYNVDTVINRGDNRQAVDTDGDGTEDTRQDTDGERPADADEADRDIKESQDLQKEEVSYDKQTKTKNLVQKVLRGGGWATAVTALACATQDIGDQVMVVKHERVILPQIRLAMQLISAGAQMQAGQNISADTIAAISETFYDIEKEDESERSFFNAKPVQAEMGNEPLGVDIKESAKPGRADDKPVFLQFIDNIPGISTVCGAQDWLSNTLGSLPGISHIMNFADQLTQKVAKELTGKSMDEWIESLVSFMSGEAVDVLATGAELGTYAAYGSKLASNDAMMAMGGTELPGTAVAQWKQYQKEEQLAENRRTPFAKRYFDLKNPQSLAARSLLETNITTSPSALKKAFTNNVFTIHGFTAKNIVKSITPAVYAQATEPYDYGFNDFGFSTSTLNDDKYSDPYCNAAMVRGTTCMNEDGDEVTYTIDHLPEFNERWGRCFGNPLDNNGKINNQELESYEHISDCDGDKNNEMFIRYRLYILDTTNAASLACYEGIDDSACGDIGFPSQDGNNSQGGSSGGSPGSLPDGDSKTLAQSILDSGKVTGDSRYMGQIQAIAEGDASCPVNPRILGLILAISQNFTVYITSLNRYCTRVLTASGAKSYHWKDGGGHAVDFGIVNGVKSTGATTEDLKLINYSLPLLPSGSGIGQLNCRSSRLDLPSGIREFNDSCNHIHIEVPVQ